MTVEELLKNIKASPDSISFNDVIDVVTTHYNYTPTHFKNGTGDDMVINNAGNNEGSCKIFAFAKLNSLGKDETLACFGSYYRDDVLINPAGSEHANIRAFMRHGWDGIQFDGEALTAR